MKQKNIIILSTLVIFSISGCATYAQSPQSKSTKHNVISEKIASKKKGYLQKHLDNWLKNEWEPTIKKVTKVTNGKEDSFTLQKYVDKAEVYAKEHPLNEENAHYKKLESLPVIGK